MKRMCLLSLVAAVACSSSVAQEAISVERPQSIPVFLAAVAPPSPPVEPRPEPRKSVRNSRIENEWLAKICVNEGGFNIVECEKLLQTLENMRNERTDKSLLNAMYTQSAKVTRRDPFTDTRQVWVSHLPMQGVAMPTGWIECTGKDPVTKRQIPAGCSGLWEPTSKVWASFRAEARRLYFSGIVPEPIGGYPIQWGGDMDYWRGVGRNFCPLNVGGPLRNTFWGDPKDPRNDSECLPIDQKKVEASKLLSAAIARGRQARKHEIPELLRGKDSLIPKLSAEATDDRTRVD